MTIARQISEMVLMIEVNSNFFPIESALSPELGKEPLVLTVTEHPLRTTNAAKEYHHVG